MSDTPNLTYLRCIKDRGGFVVGEVYPAWSNAKGDLVIAVSESSRLTLSRDAGPELREYFRPASVEEFEQTVTAAMRGVDEVGQAQMALYAELGSLNTQLLDSGDGPAADGPSSTALARTNPAGQLRNKANQLKRQAGEIALAVKERKEWLEAKVGQKLALALASLKDVEGVVKKLEEVVYTVQLYLGRDEEVTVLRDGECAPEGTPISIRQNVLYMDEECALAESHGIDFREIDRFDAWLLAKPEHLKQVLPEPKGVVVLQVRRNPKEYQAETAAEMFAAASANQANKQSYWLIRNGERLHRIWADIIVGPRLLPNSDELDHFFFDHSSPNVATANTPHRPGSRSYLEAMEQSDAVRRHYMRLALVLQGLVDRTQLLAPFKDNRRPNLLDPEGNAGLVTFIRDVEGTLTDGRPSFDSWLTEVNRSVSHGHRIVGQFPTYHHKDEKCRVSPQKAEGVNEEDVHTVLERGGELYFLFKRTDEIYRRRGFRHHASLESAKTPGRYQIESRDKFFVCIDSPLVTIEAMEYYLADRRHRRSYENMVPSLRKAIDFLRREESAEQPFRELLQRKLTEATPETPATPEAVAQLIRWWKTKTKEHRALLANDAKAYRMILERHVAQAGGKNLSSDREAFLGAVHRMPDAIYAYHIGDRDFGVLLRIEGHEIHLREELWRVTKGTAHRVSEKQFVLPQKAHYETYTALLSTSTWQAIPQHYQKGKFLNPAHYPALIAWVRGNPWFQNNDTKCDERLVAVYIREDEKGTSIRAASFELNPSRSGRWTSDEEKSVGLTDDCDMPSGHEREVLFTGAKEPRFRYRFNYTTATHIDFSGQLTCGWMKNDATRALFVDETVLADVREAMAQRLEHNHRADALNSWVRAATQSAAAAIEAQWKARQTEKYLAEDGDLSFLDDHLATLSKKLPDVSFLRSVLTRALNAGKTIEELSARGVTSLLQEFKPHKAHPFGGESEEITPSAEAVEQLANCGWTPPPVSAGDDD